MGMDLKGPCRGEVGDESDVVVGQKTFEMPTNFKSGYFRNIFAFYFPRNLTNPSHVSFFGSYLADVTDINSRAIFVCICIPPKSIAVLCRQSTLQNQWNSAALHNTQCALFGALYLTQIMFILEESFDLGS